MIERKGCQQQYLDEKLPFHSHIFESLQLEGLHVGDLLWLMSESLRMTAVGSCCVFGEQWSYG